MAPSAVRWAPSWLRYLAGLRFAPYVPAPPSVCVKMLELAQLSPGEKLVDLGCGDGRLLLTAVSPPFSASSAIGFELDAELCDTARADAALHPFGARISIQEVDILKAGPTLAEADVVSVYLTQGGNMRVLPLLRQHLQPTARVVSYVWSFGDTLPPTRAATATGANVVLSIGQPNVRLREQRDLFYRSGGTD